MMEREKLKVMKDLMQHLLPIMENKIYQLYQSLMSNFSDSKDLLSDHVEVNIVLLKGYETVYK